MIVVIPSVDYSDHLAVTLPAWRELLPNAAFTVVTSPAPADRETVAIAKQHGARALVTDCWQRWGAVFNKGLALDLAFGLVGEHTPAPASGEVCLALDADVYPSPYARRPLDLETGVLASTLYSVPRYHCPDPDTLCAHVTGRLPLEGLALLPPRSGGQDSAPLRNATPQQVHDATILCLGYFQLWRHAPAYRFYSSHSAGGYDMSFARRFKRRRQALSGLYVLHLGARSRDNWRGRVLPRWPAEARA